MPEMQRDGFWGYQPTPEATLGQAIYHAALAGRMGFLPNDQTNDYTDAEWTAIFTDIGRAAQAAALPDLTVTIDGETWSGVNPMGQMLTHPTVKP